MTLYLNYQERPTRAEYKGTSRGGGSGPDLCYNYDVGRYAISIDLEALSDRRGAHEEAVTYRTRYGSEDVHAALPNVCVEDGELTLPLTDLVGLVLDRLPPAELARTLWDDADVRAEFVECLAHRYSETGVGDLERRQVLKRVREVIHSTALDRLAATMAKMEYEIDRAADLYHMAQRINDGIRDLVRRGIITQQLADSIGQLDPHPRDDVLKIGGKAWTEARAHWRQRVEQLFPGPNEETDRLRAAVAAVRAHGIVEMDVILDEYLSVPIGENEDEEGPF